MNKLFEVDKDKDKSELKQIEEELNQITLKKKKSRKSSAEKLFKNDDYQRH